MKIIDFFIREWREFLSIEESKEAFFHGCKALLNAKQYDRLFRNFRNHGEVLYYSTESKEIYLKTEDSIIVKTDFYYDIFLEIFVDKIYRLPPFVLIKDFVVFDVGMNRGYASLFFAKEKHCKHVYGFELVEEIYQLAIENISLNPQLKNKITPFNYGLWNEDKKVSIKMDGIDGHASIKGVPENMKKTINQEAIVKKSSKVIDELYKELDEQSLKILKIDVEGSEYTIFEDLYKHGLLKEFDVIIGEYHNGLNGLEKYLSENFYCSYKENTYNSYYGMIVYINKKLKRDEDN